MFGVNFVAELHFSSLLKCCLMLLTEVVCQLLTNASLAVARLLFEYPCLDPLSEFIYIREISSLVVISFISMTHRYFLIKGRIPCHSKAPPNKLVVVWLCSPVHGVAKRPDTHSCIATCVKPKIIGEVVIPFTAQPRSYFTQTVQINQKEQGSSCSLHNCVADS